MATVYMGKYEVSPGKHLTYLILVAQLILSQEFNGIIHTPANQCSCNVMTIQWLKLREIYRLLRNSIINLDK